MRCIQLSQRTAGTSLAVCQSPLGFRSPWVMRWRKMRLFLKMLPSRWSCLHGQLVLKVFDSPCCNSKSCGCAVMITTVCEPQCPLPRVVESTLVMPWVCFGHCQWLLHSQWHDMWSNPPNRTILLFGMVTWTQSNVYFCR